MSRLFHSADTTFTMQSVTVPEPVISKSIFTSSQLKPKNFQVRYAPKYQPDWILVILITCLILIAWTRVFYYKRMQQIFRAPFSKRFINQLTRDGNLFRERISVALGMVYIFVTSMIFYEFNREIVHIPLPYLSPIAVFWTILIIFVAFQTAKVALIRFLGIIFKTRETTNSYILNLLIFTLFSGPVLLVLLILHLYLKSVVLLYLCLVFLGLLLIFRFVRGFFIGISLRKFSYLFLFVYLCTLEILPLLVIIKMLLIHAHPAGG